MQAIPSETPLSPTAFFTSSVMSVTVRPPAVRRRVSCWNTFIVEAILRESLPDEAVEPAHPQWILQDAVSGPTLTCEALGARTGMASHAFRLGAMDEGRRSQVSLNALLAAVEAAPPVAAVDVLAAELAEAIGAREVSFLIADFSGRSLIRLGHSGGVGALRLQGKETAERVALVETPHGRALTAQTVEVVVEGRGARVFAPVTSRGEAVGVLELALEDPPAAETVADVALAAHFLAYVVIANRRYTDLFEWGQRSVPLSLAAEIQHRLLPGSFTCEAGQFTLAAWLQPAGEIGGDTFDFSLDRGALHLSMTDAMGQTMDATLLATVLVGGLRDAELLNISAILTASRSMHAREAVQHLTQEVLGASRGELRDDATALCLDWGGGVPRDRDADSGANR